MSPEAICIDCDTRIAQPTKSALQASELIHHINSVDLDALNETGKIIHKCSAFAIFDDEGREISSDFFAHGKFRFSDQPLGMPYNRQ